MKTQVFKRYKSRGSVMILVVAILGLLAVMGTVYIVSARAGRATSSAMATAENLDLARSAVMSQVQQTIGNAMVDKDNQIGGFSNTAPSLAARNYDYPELGTPATGATTYNDKMKAEAWLVTKLHAQTINDVSLLTPTPFNPITGTYSGQANVLFPNANSNRMDTVVGDRTNILTGFTTKDLTTDDPPVNNVSDAYINLLPFSEASGLRYRFGVRILDTNRMANLNTGATDDTAALTDSNGTYLSSLRLAPVTGTLPTPNAYFNTTDIPINLQSAAGGLGRIGVGSSNTIFSPQGWHDLVMRIEQPTDSKLSFFDLGDELSLRTYGEYGDSFHIRAANGGSTTPVWPLTLSVDKQITTPTGTVIGNPSRRNYTTYSFSRDIRTYPDPFVNPAGVNTAPNVRYTLTPSGGTSTAPWPSTYAKVPVNTTLNTADSLAKLATEVATAMKYTANQDYASTLMGHTDPADATNQIATFPVEGTILPFTQSELCAYTANFMMARWSGLVPDPAVTTATAYFLPAGPSFVDSQGICVRTATSSSALVVADYSGTNDVHATGTDAYIGYSAQPFINEVAAYGTQASSADPIVIAEFAIELYNPYKRALSLNGWQIRFGTGSAYTFPSNQYIPANGFYVLRTSGTHLPDYAGATPQEGNTLPVPAAGSTILKLYRPYIPRTASVLDASHAVEVDAFDCSVLFSGSADVVYDATGKSFSLGRSNLGSSVWGTAYNSGDIFQATITLGAANLTGTVASYPLYDRFAGTPEFGTFSNQQSPFVNIAEFNRIMRICTVVDKTNSLAEAIPLNGLVTDHMNSVHTSAATSIFAATQFLKEGEIYFDFRPQPGIYSTSPPTEVAGGTIVEGDIRATRFLDQIAFIDRVSDATIDIGNGTSDINKLRLPGQINVNTASGDVLRAIPNMTNPMVANILAYRDRAITTVPDSRFGTSTIDYKTQAGNYPGSGIRSLAELMIPISDAVGSGSLSDRDRVWASIYNLCTVRSDTFCIYGYLEAVRQNPNATGTTNWYGAVSDDPHADASIPLIRVSRRRWVAIVDRSWSNYSAGTTYVAPRIVAIKDLPQ